MLTNMANIRQRRRVRRAAALSLVSALALPPAATLAQGRTPATPTTAPARPALPPWVVKSNALARVWLEAQAKLSPEGAGQSGVDGLDEAITDITPGFRERAKATVEAARKTLQEKLAAETDPQVKQDLTIMVKDADDTLDGFAVQRKYLSLIHI